MRRLWIVLLALVVVGGLGVGAYVGISSWWDQARHATSSGLCTVSGYELDPEQAEVAATMTGTVVRLGLPEHATILALAAGLQESKLHNLPPGAGDRDSVGVLQQRPSQGWGGGDASRLNDVGEATREFLARIVKLPGWRTRPIGKVIQDVQVSADPSGDSYAQHGDEARSLARAFDGAAPRAITCSFEAPTKIAAAAKVAQLVQGDLPINAPTTSAQAVHVPGAHWQTAAWFVAYAYRLGIDQVRYGGYTWSRAHGWKHSTASAGEVVAVL